MNVTKAEAYIVQKLRLELSETLYYHGLHHTLDVTDAALRLAKMEGIADAETLDLIKTAALYHDSGFLKVYQLHEEESCRIARAALADFGYTPEQIEMICGMIIATKIPQSPQTHLEQILCDADLDYLGRNDFEPIAATLYNELKARGKVGEISEWNKLQVKFIGAHNYWTQSARNLRDDQKQQNLQSLL
jgi:HD superfamily phosphodiesterase